MPTRLIGWPAAILAMLITLTLVAGELTNAGQRRWWAARPLTTDTVSGLLVLLYAAAPLLRLLHPAIRDSIQGIGRTAEE